MSYDFTTPVPDVPHVESNFFDRFFGAEGVDPHLRAVATKLRADGYAVIDFPVDDFDSLADGVIRDLGHKYDFEGWRSRKGASRLGGLRVQDAMDSESVRRIATCPPVLELLEKLFGRKPFPFQTLNFPVGTDQHFHTDAVHFHSMPERFMVGVWVALEDIGEDQGPLYYFPGSHKLPIYENHQYGIHFREGATPPTQTDYEPHWRALVEATGLQREVFLPRKGQALIWLSNLLHGGMEHRDLTRTRWSQVTHYYFEGCAYYTPMYSYIPEGTIFFREPLDVSTGERRKCAIGNRPLAPDWIARATPDLSRVDDDLLPTDFKKERYLQLNPDVRVAGVDPIVHYLTYGAAEGRPYK